MNDFYLGGTLELFTAQGMDSVEVEIIVSVPFGVQLPNITGLGQNI
jgi:hypothetical protein